MTPIRLLILAQDLLTRAGLAAILQTQDDVYVVGQFPASDTLTEDLQVYRPEVVLFDLGYEPSAAMPALTDIVEAELPVLALLSDADSAAGIMTVLSDLSAYGLLLRDSMAEQLTQALKGVVAGLVVLDPQIAEFLAPAEQNGITAPPPLDDLTPREKEVLRLVAQGLPNKGIAVALGISPNTVKFHVNAILSKLDVRTRTEAVVRATQFGLILL